VSKKSLDRKATKQFIIDNRSLGKTDQEIYNLLAEQYYDKKTIALLITSQVTTENRKKYKVLNTLLLVLISITILFKILAIVQLSLSAGQVWALIFIFLVPLLNIYFFYEVLRYNGTIYRILGLLTMASFLQSISKGGTVLDITIGAFLCILIVGLAFYLDNYMFPYYSPSHLKKDSNGEYILS